MTTTPPASWSSSPAVVLLSGGQDSTTCLFWAREQFRSVSTVTFDYGQRHRAELDAASEVSRLARAERHRVVRVDSLAEVGGSSLVDHALPVEGAGFDGLPSSFVPGRNLLFLTLAAAVAYQWGVRHLVAGLCHTDYSGYPDCRDGAVAATQAALTLGMDRPFSVHTPLMWLSKRETVQMARELPGCWAALAGTVTCYEGVPACRRCPACRLRERGFEEAGLPDPALEEAQA